MSTWRMRLASRLLGVDLATLSNGAENKSITTAWETPEWRSGTPIFSNWSTEHAIREGYTATAALYACTEIISDAAASVPLIVYKHGVEQEWEPYTDHPMQPLLDKPNPFMSREATIKRLTQHLLLGGNAILTKMRFKTGPLKGLPAELWPLMPDLVKPVPDRKKFISGYVWEAYGEKHFIDVDDILHFMQINPADPYWGIGSVQAIALAVDTDRSAQLFQRVGMLNRGVVDGVLGFKMPLSPDQYERARDVVDKGLRGVENARKILVIGNDANYTKLGLTAEEMDFVESRKFTREEILQGMRVPPPMAGVYDDATLANIETSRKIFWLDRIVPMLTGIAAVFNQTLVTDFGEDPRDVWIGFDTTSVDALQQNLNEKVEAFKDLVASRVKPWVAARVVGLDIAEEDVEVEGVVASIPSAPKVKGAMTSPTWSEKRKTDFWFAHEDRRIEWEDVFAEHILSQFLREGERAVALVRQGQLEVSAAIDEDEWHNLLTMFYRAAMLDFAQATFAALLRGVKASPYARMTTEVEQVSEYVMMNHVQHITETTREQARKTVIDTMRDSGTVDDVARNLRNKFEEFGTQRSYVIARTEMGNVSNYGNRIGANEVAGIYDALTYKFWISARDARVRDSHAAMEEAGPIPINEVYPNGLMYPGAANGPAAEVIQCRCTEGYEFREMLDDQDAQQLAQAEDLDEAAAEPTHPDDFQPQDEATTHMEMTDAHGPEMWEENFSTQQRNSVINYTGDGFEDVNPTLRRGLLDSKVRQDGMRTPAVLRKHVKNIDTVMSHPESYLRNDALLTRGYNSPVALPADPAKMVGSTLTDPAYMSTSTSSKRAGMFMRATDENPIRVTIRAKSGTRGIYVDPVSKHWGEQEFLMPRGTKLRVIEARLETAKVWGREVTFHDVVAIIE